MLSSCWDIISLHMNHKITNSQSVIKALKNSKFTFFNHAVTPIIRIRLEGSIFSSREICGFFFLGGGYPFWWFFSAVEQLKMWIVVLGLHPWPNPPRWTRIFSVSLSPHAPRQIYSQTYSFSEIYSKLKSVHVQYDTFNCHPRDPGTLKNCPNHFHGLYAAHYSFNGWTSQFGKIFEKIWNVIKAVGPDEKVMLD